MKKTCSLLFGSLIVLAGIAPAWADGVPVKAAKEVVNVIEGGALAVNAANTSSRATKAILDMREALISTGTKAAALAQTPTRPAAKVRQELGINGPLQVGWASMTQAANLALEKASITPVQTAQLVLETNPKAFEALDAQQQGFMEYMMLANYPAVAIEGPTVLGKMQVERALKTYQEIIQNAIDSRGLGGTLPKWAQAMAAATNIGFFADKEGAVDLLINLATKINHGILTGPTDVIVVRALLNLGAPEKIQTLVDIRLKSIDGNGSPMMLSYEWGEIQKYMQEAGLELNIPQNRIAPMPEKPVLSRMPTAEGWMMFYNPYNAFTADPSARTTKNFLILRKAIEEKAFAIEIQQGLDANGAH